MTNSFSSKHASVFNQIVLFQLELNTISNCAMPWSVPFVSVEVHEFSSSAYAGWIVSVVYDATIDL